MGHLREGVDADVLICGGGFVGMALASTLADAGLSSVIVEAGNPEAALSRHFDGRASAIALSSRRLLQAVSVWELISDTAAPMLHIRVSEGGSRLFLQYDHRDVGDEPFGYMLENRVLRRGLMQRCRQHADIRFISGTRITVVERTLEGVMAELSTGSRVRARLLVAADGRESRLRDDAGIRVSGWSYAQNAIVTTVEHPVSHGFTAHEHFLPAGPFAILPLLPETRSSIVWTESSDLAPLILKKDEEGFTQELRRRFGTFLGDVRPIGPRFTYPLSLQFAVRATDRRFALVGDALHAMHPIAGQGLNMGFRDVAALTEVLSDARAAGEDLGSPAVLARYERWRRFDNTLMLAMTDGLNRLFSNNIPPLRLARDLGLAAVNRLAPLKRVFMLHAMGLVGEVPRLMRG